MLVPAAAPARLFWFLFGLLWRRGLWWERGVVRIRCWRRTSHGVSTTGTTRRGISGRHRRTSTSSGTRGRTFADVCCRGSDPRIASRARERSGDGQEVLEISTGCAGRCRFGRWNVDVSCTVPCGVALRGYDRLGKHFVRVPRTSLGSAKKPKVVLKKAHKSVHVGARGSR